MSWKNEVFDAEAISLGKLFLINSGIGCFRVPIYQRDYDWDKENIQRFFEDILAGLYYKIDDPVSLTFLGTIIILPEDSPEKDWGGSSYAVIDGQQRLTTCSLIASILHREINTSIQNQNTEDEAIKNWILSEAREHLNRLAQIIYGKVVLFGDNTFPFARVIRHNDHRASDEEDSEYTSAIGNFLYNHGLSIHKATIFPYENFILQDYIREKNGKVLKRNLNYIEEFINEIKEEETHEHFKLLSIKDFEKKNLRDLFIKLGEDDYTLCQKFKSGDKNLFSFLRLITFSSYFFNNVIITQVEAKDEKYAFDIFDSLNTTGEPLTAVQTFKPIVIKSVGEKKYTRSKSKEYFDIIEKYIENYNSTYKKQEKSKDLIIPFALYINGQKISRNLYLQRRHLKNEYESISTNIDKENYLKSFSDVVEYVDTFWTPYKELPPLNGYPDRDIVQVCLKLLFVMNKSLTIPILTRYYTASLEKSDPALFSDAVKALTAFVVLRRSITGGTAGIDSIFRDLMTYGDPDKSSKSNIPLKLGLNNENELVSIKNFKIYLQNWLDKGKYTFKNKSEWVKKACQTGLYQNSKELSKFLILAAIHNSRQDPKEHWKLNKVKKSLEIDYLRLKIWNSELFSSVEHIAPQSNQTGWDNNIYHNNYTVHSIGNLTLIPKVENSAAGNKNWKYKIALFKACTAESEEEIEKILEEAKIEGIKFSKKVLESLKKGQQMPYLKAIISVNTWDKNHIENRSENIFNLVWEEIEPWLFDVKSK